MKQAVNPIQSLNTAGRVLVSNQQCRQIDSGELGQNMGHADEAAEHTVAKEAIGEIGIARTAYRVALVPVGPRLGVEHRSQSIAVECGVRGRGALAEELPEIGVSRQRPKPGELQLEQRKVSFIEVDGVNLSRLRRQIRQRIAS